MFHTYLGTFITLDILRYIYTHLGIFRQISESLHNYSVSPTLTRFTSKHTTDTTHASVPPTPSTLARIAHHFSNSPKKKVLEDYQYMKNTEDYQSTTYTIAELRMFLKWNCLPCWKYSIFVGVGDLNSQHR